MNAKEKIKKIFTSNFKVSHKTFLTIILLIFFLLFASWKTIVLAALIFGIGYWLSKQYKYETAAILGKIYYFTWRDNNTRTWTLGILAIILITTSILFFSHPPLVSTEFNTQIEMTNWQKHIHNLLDSKYYYLDNIKKISTPSIFGWKLLFTGIMLTIIFLIYLPISFSDEVFEFFENTINELKSPTTETGSAVNEVMKEAAKKTGTTIASSGLEHIFGSLVGGATLEAVLKTYKNIRGRK